MQEYVETMIRLQRDLALHATGGNIALWHEKLLESLVADARALAALGELALVRRLTGQLLSALSTLHSLEATDAQAQSGSACCVQTPPSDRVPGADAAAPARAASEPQPAQTDGQVRQAPADPPGAHPGVHGAGAQGAGGSSESAGSTADAGEAEPGLNADPEPVPGLDPGASEHSAEGADPAPARAAGEAPADAPASAGAQGPAGCSGSTDPWDSDFAPPPSCLMEMAEPGACPEPDTGAYAEPDPGVSGDGAESLLATEPKPAADAAGPEPHAGAAQGGIEPAPSGVAFMEELLRRLRARLSSRGLENPCLWLEGFPCVHFSGGTEARVEFAVPDEAPLQMKARRLTLQNLQQIAKVLLEALRAVRVPCERIQLTVGNRRVVVRHVPESRPVGKGTNAAEAARSPSGIGLPVPRTHVSAAEAEGQEGAPRLQSARKLMQADRSARQSARAEVGAAAGSDPALEAALSLFGTGA